MYYFFGRKNPRIWILIGLIIFLGYLGINPFRADSAETIEYYANEVLSFLIIAGLIFLILGAFWLVFKFIFRSTKKKAKANDAASNVDSYHNESDED